MTWEALAWTCPARLRRQMVYTRLSPSGGKRLGLIGQVDSAHSDQIPTAAERLGISMPVLVPRFGNRSVGA